MPKDGSPTRRKVRSTFQGRSIASDTYHQTNWFREVMTKEKNHFVRSVVKPRANGPITEPFPRYRDRPVMTKSGIEGTPLGWNFEDVASWLERLGLHKYTNYFRKHLISGPALLALQRDQLPNLGIRDRHDQDILLSGSRYLKREVKKASYSESKALPRNIRRGSRFSVDRSPFVRKLESQIRHRSKDRRKILWKRRSTSGKKVKSSSTLGGTTTRNVDDLALKKKKKIVSFVPTVVKASARVRKDKTAVGSKKKVYMPRRSRATERPLLQQREEPKPKRNGTNDKREGHRKERTAKRVAHMMRLFRYHRPHFASRTTRDGHSSGNFFYKRSEMRTGL